ncbi:unnamed protein product [Pseudo-nitzschia multistriata]|uniref:Protein CASP n=1 Tax=Pseudo-nitzschia multistriata TaxID=183589 RepID=A0A448ZMI3_9STRA|nr:unnamed protein product [Pseudo-nitzschia multistriata]
MMKMMGGGGGAAPAPPSANAALVLSLQKASRPWKSFDWATRSSQWGSVASENRESRESSQAARKQLAETTKSFKKAVKTVETSGKTLASGQGTEESLAAAAKAIEAVSKQARITVKSYQEEIDNLTRRSKGIESAFDKLTNALQDLQDPSGLLAAAMEQLNAQQQQVQRLTQKADEASTENASLDAKLQKAIEAERAARSSAAANSSSKEEKEEIIQLRREVAEYEVEFRSLKNQDITIRKLENRIEELQQGGEEEFRAKLEAAKQELEETEGRRTTEALEREAAMERKVETLQLQLKAEAAGRAATNKHMLEASEGLGEREAAWDAQRRILVDDAERVRVMLHEATRERDELRLKVAALDGAAPAAPPSGGIPMADLLNERKAYEAEVAELSHTVNALREEIGVKDHTILDGNRTLQSRIDVLEEENAALSSELEHTTEQLESAPSQSLVDSMKRELRILKRLEYNAEDPDMPESDPEIAGRNEDEGKDLESVLVAKLRRVEADLVKERNKNTDLQKAQEALNEEVKTLEQARVDAETVVATLEQDLDRAIKSSTATKAQGSDAETTTAAAMPMAPSDPSALQSVLDPNAPPPPPQPVPPTPTSAQEKASDDRSVANIIMSQRDRLRTRCDALEAERDSFKRELQIQVEASESLRSDNTKLFEKMRYLQSYNKSGGGRQGGSNAYARQNSRDLDLEALEQRYEASVDPFRQFGKSERQRKLQEMSPMERTVFVVAKTMLGTKEMRTFLFFYVSALHLLVFSTTMHWSHSDSGHDCLLLQEQHSHLPPLHDHSGETAGS